MSDGTQRPLLLVTRNFPPQVGGMERYAADLHHMLSQRMPVTLLANRRGKRGIPGFALRVLGHVIRHRQRYGRIHFADAALAPLALLVRGLVDAPVSITTHALDVIFPNALYQWLIPASLRRLDGVVSVSRFTREACIARGVDPSRCRVIPNGIRAEAAPEVRTGVADGDRLPAAVRGKRCLVSVGRLVERKGVAWFIDQVMPKLGPEWVYLVAGDGPHRAEIERAISRQGLGTRVFLLGRVDEPVKRALLDSADWFVMPNRSIPGDAEGFGISIIESTWGGLPVIATGIEGIRDAVIDGRTGRLLPEGDIDAWVDALAAPPPDRGEVARETQARFSWERIVGDYLDFFAVLPERQ